MQGSDSSSASDAAASSGSAPRPPRLQLVKQLDIPCIVKYIDRRWLNVDGERSSYLAELISEHTALSSSKHPHIVEYYDTFPTPSFVGLAYEHAGEDLATYVHEQGGKLPEGTALYVFQQVILALDFCLRSGSKRRDIRPETLFVTVGLRADLPKVKLNDFDFGKYWFNCEDPLRKLKAALFLAPELCLWPSDAERIDLEAAAVFSAGVLLFVLLFGQHPFLPECFPCSKHPQQWHTDANLSAELLKHLLSSSMLLSETHTALATSPLMRAAHELTSAMLVAQPSQRLRVSQVMQHPLFLEGLPASAAGLTARHLAAASASSAQQQSPTSKSPSGGPSEQLGRSSLPQSVGAAAAAPAPAPATSGGSPAPSAVALGGSSSILSLGRPSEAAAAAAAAVGYDSSGGVSERPSRTSDHMPIRTRDSAKTLVLDRSSVPIAEGGAGAGAGGGDASPAYVRTDSCGARQIGGAAAADEGGAGAHKRVQIRNRSQSLSGGPGIRKFGAGLTLIRPMSSIGGDRGSGGSSTGSATVAAAVAAAAAQGQTLEMRRSGGSPMQPQRELQVQAVQQAVAAQQEAHAEAQYLAMSERKFVHARRSLLQQATSQSAMAHQQQQQQQQALNLQLQQAAAQAQAQQQYVHGGGGGYDAGFRSLQHPIGASQHQQQQQQQQGGEPSGEGRRCSMPGNVSLTRLMTPQELHPFTYAANLQSPRGGPLGVSSSRDVRGSPAVSQQHELRLGSPRVEPSSASAGMLWPHRSNSPADYRFRRNVSLHSHAGSHGGLPSRGSHASYAGSHGLSSHDSYGVLSPSGVLPPAPFGEPYERRSEPACYVEGDAPPLPGEVLEHQVGYGDVQFGRSGLGVQQQQGMPGEAHLSGPSEAGHSGSQVVHRSLSSILESAMHDGRGSRAELERVAAAQASLLAMHQQQRGGAGGSDSNAWGPETSTTRPGRAYLCLSAPAHGGSYEPYDLSAAGPANLQQQQQQQQQLPQQQARSPLTDFMSGLYRHAHASGLGGAGGGLGSEPGFAAGGSGMQQQQQASGADWQQEAGGSRQAGGAGARGGASELMWQLENASAAAAAARQAMPPPPPGPVRMLGTSWGPAGGQPGGGEGGGAPVFGVQRDTAFASQSDSALDPAPAMVLSRWMSEDRPGTRPGSRPPSNSNNRFAPDVARLLAADADMGDELAADVSVDELALSSQMMKDASMQLADVMLRSVFVTPPPSGDVTMGQHGPSGNLPQVRASGSGGGSGGSGGGQDVPMGNAGSQPMSPCVYVGGARGGFRDDQGEQYREL